MRTIERNYQKNPHTANFLMTFHQAAYGLPSDAEETTVADADLLDLVPETTVTDARSPKQEQVMNRLIAQITELDEATGAAAQAWTDKATASGVYWTPGFEGTASAWITKLIAKVRELKVAAAKPISGSPAATVADGRYAVEEDGTLKFFRVKNGRNAGVVFLDVQASDDWHKVSNVTRIRKILALIAQDPKAAIIRYGHELGECGRCGRTLTDAASRAAGIGPICASRD